MAKWTRDEVILTLDLYLSSGHRVLAAERPECIELAEFLTRLRNAAGHTPTDALRTPGSVEMKLANLRAIDPADLGEGMGNISKLDLEVWQEFANDPQKLNEAVRLIRSKVR